MLVRHLFATELISIDKCLCEDERCLDLWNELLNVPKMRQKIFPVFI